MKLLEALVDQYVTDAIEKWKEENPPEKIIAETIAELNSAKREIIPKLLGFDKGWEKWRVDHCNGRAGNSAAGDYLRSACQQAVKDWFEKIKLPAMTKGMQDDFKKEYISTVKKILREEAKRLAEANVRAYANDAIEKISITMEEIENA